MTGHVRPYTLQRDLGADAFLGEYFEEQGVRNPAVYDMDLGAAGVESLETGFGLGDHPSGDNAFLDKGLHLFLIER
jgi:hypothetical protein